MPANDELPDWLRELRDQQVGSDFEPGDQTVPAEPAAPPPEAAPAPSEMDLLREKATAEPPVEEPPERRVPIISDLSPFQRFVLALLLFLNVSLLGCMFLIVLGKIALIR